MNIIIGADGYPLGTCFGYPAADPASCTHPLAAQFCSFITEPLLMCGKTRAPEYPGPEGPWAAPGKPGKTGEYWYTEEERLYVRCFACGRLLSEGSIADATKRKKQR